MASATLSLAVTSNCPVVTTVSAVLVVVNEIFELLAVVIVAPVPDWIDNAPLLELPMLITRFP